MRVNIWGLPPKLKRKNLPPALKRDIILHKGSMGLGGRPTPPKATIAPSTKTQYVWDFTNFCNDSEYVKKEDSFLWDGVVVTTQRRFVGSMGLGRRSTPPEATIAPEGVLDASSVVKNPNKPNKIQKKRIMFQR